MHSQQKLEFRMTLFEIAIVCSVWALWLWVDSSYLGTWTLSGGWVKKGLSKLYWDAACGVHARQSTGYIGSISKKGMGVIYLQASSRPPHHRALNQSLEPSTPATLDTLLV